MVLTPHAIVGATITSFFKLNPFTAFVAGFLSHFFIDLIPHWDYRLKSARLDEACPINNDVVIGSDFYIDLVKTGFDASLGLALSLVLFTVGGGISLWPIVFGAIGGIAPDALQFAYMKYRREPLLSLQRTHILFHSSHKIYNPVLGVFIYCLLITLCLFLGNWSFFIW